MRFPFSWALREHSVAWKRFHVVFITLCGGLSFPPERKGKGDLERRNEARPVGAELELGSRVQALPTLLPCCGLHTLEGSSLACTPLLLCCAALTPCQDPVTSDASCLLRPFLSPQEVRSLFCFQNTSWHSHWFYFSPLSGQLVGHVLVGYKLVAAKNPACPLCVPVVQSSSSGGSGQEESGGVFEFVLFTLRCARRSVVLLTPAKLSNSQQGDVTCRLHLYTRFRVICWVPLGISFSVVK